MRESNLKVTSINSNLFPLRPIFQRVEISILEDLTASIMSNKRKSSTWSFNPLKWVISSKGKKQVEVGTEVEEPRKQEPHIHAPDWQKKDEKIEEVSEKEEVKGNAEAAPTTSSSPPPPPPLPPNEAIIFISSNYEPECQSRIQDSFCTLKTTFIPSYEHLRGTQAVVAELKQVHKRMKEKRREERRATRGSGSWSTDSEDEEDGENEMIQYGSDSEDTIITLNAMPQPKPRKSLESKNELVIIDNAPLPLPRASKVA